MKRPFLLALSALVLTISATWLYAGPPKPWKPAEWKVAKEQYNIINAVNTSTGTVSISHIGGKDKQDRDLTINPFTEIVVDGQKTTIASLKAGMHIDYTLGGDGSVASRIETKAEHAPPPTPVPTATPSFPHFDNKKQPPSQ